jgi:hypothetical protein
MPRDSSGNTTPLPGTIVSLGQTIQPSQHNPMVEDLYAMMTQSLSRDGQGGMRANLDMGGFQVRNLPAASLPNDAIRKAELDSLSGALDDFEGLLSFGQCRLTLSGGNLSLGRFNGRLLTINGISETIPSTAPTLAATSLTPSTLYYIYAYMNSGTMTLEASTTAYATDATTGVVVMTGDATRTLVGMARPVTGPAWVDSATQRFVLSWFNRRDLPLLASRTSNISTTSTSYVDLTSDLELKFLTWADEPVSISYKGLLTTSSGAVLALSAIRYDAAGTGKSVSATANTFFVPVYGESNDLLSEGYHTANLSGAANGVATMTMTATANSPIYTQGVVRG